MVQIKKQTPAKQGKGKQQEVKKPQLQFSSSDEDSENELGEEAEDEEVFDEEFSDEELFDEEFEDEEEEEEDEVEGIVPTKAQVVAKNAKVEAKVTPKKTPTKPEPTPKAKAVETPKAKAAVTPKGKAADTPKAKAADTPKAKANGNDTPAKGAQKRKAEELTVKTPAKQSKLTDQSNIIDEETRRREERNKRSLFFKGVGKVVKKMTEIKGLHPDIVSVRTMGLNAWALFASEAACVKAHDVLKEKSVNGKKLTLDFCGLKAKNTKPEGTRGTDKPINKLALLVAGLPNGTTSDKLKLIFPNSKAIELPKASKKNTTVAAFVHFATEQEAQNAFVKNESLKIGGTPVEVLFARQRD